MVRGKPRRSGRGRIARTAAPSYNGVAADNQGSLRQGMPEVTPVEIRAAVAHSAQEPTEATHSGSMPGERRRNPPTLGGGGCQMEKKLVSVGLRIEESVLLKAKALAEHSGITESAFIGVNG